MNTFSFYLLGQIFDRLNIDDLLSCNRVCKTFYQAIDYVSILHEKIVVYRDIYTSSKAYLIPDISNPEKKIKLDVKKNICNNVELNCQILLDIPYKFGKGRVEFEVITRGNFMRNISANKTTYWISYDLSKRSDGTYDFHFEESVGKIRLLRGGNVTETLDKVLDGVKANEAVETRNNVKSKCFIHNVGFFIYRMYNIHVFPSRHLYTISYNFKIQRIK